jgi:hypothetical protein
VKFNTSSANLQTGSTLSDGLVGLWTFDGGDVTTVVADRSGQNNNGYFYGGATSSAKIIGKLGQALNFDGTSNAVVTSSMDMPGQQISASFWGKFPSFMGADFQNVFYKHRVSPDESAPQFSLEFDNPAGADCSDPGVPKIAVFGGGNASQGANCYVPPSVNTWHHFVATYDKSVNPDVRAPCLSP